MHEHREYRQRARDCLAMAATIRDADQRKQFLAMMQAWVTLAEQVERREGIVTPDGE